MEKEVNNPIIEMKRVTVNSLGSELMKYINCFFADSVDEKSQT